MRWGRRIRLLLIELIAIALAAVIAVLENVLTNEKHPGRAIVWGLVSLVVISGIAQGIGRIRREAKEAQSASDIRSIQRNTSEILELQQTSKRTTEEIEIDQTIGKFPYILRSYIKGHWRKSPQEVRQVIETVGESKSRPPLVLKEWQQILPGWLANAGCDATLVAAELANGYGENELAAQLFLKAVPASTRPQYWTARASLILHLQGLVKAAMDALANSKVDAHSAEPLARIVFCLVTGELEPARTLLGQWDPDEPIDILLAGIIRIALILADVGESGGQPTGEHYRQTARTYRDLVATLPSSASFRVGLASSLIGLVTTGVSTDPHRDLDEALQQAIIGRDLVRESRGNSVPAVELACQAAYSDRQLRRTIQIGTAATGEASIEEASSDKVRTLVAAAALSLGDHTLADRSILEIDDPFRKSLLVAMSAEAADRPSADLWRAALQLARDAGERSEALLGLARMGLAQPADIEAIQSELPHQAALIEAVSTAVSGNVADAIRQLRTMQGTDLNAVTALAAAYLQAGNEVAAADTLREGARMLNQPRLRVEAARLLSESGRHDEAVEELEALLIDSGSDAALRHDCLGILAEWAAEKRDWVTAQARFQEFLTLDPGDSKARWALMLVLLQRGLAADARRVYDEAPTQPAITLPSHARAWMATRSAADRQAASEFVNAVVDVAQKFPDDEDVQAEAIFTVLSPDSRDSAPLPAATQARFDDLFHRFFEKWPQSARLRRFSAVDVQALLSQMEELIRPTQEEKRLRAEIADQLARNTLPWATLSAITGRTYSEIVLVRGGGVLPAQTSDAAETLMCRTAAKAAIDKSVVIDISTAAVLLEIPELADRLIGQFERLLISEQQRLDAISAEFQLRSRSTSSWIYDEQSDRGRLINITPEAAEERHRKITALLDLINRCRVTPISTNARMEAMGELAASTWVTTVECAAQSGATFWCDDVALRAAARSIGVAAFSTPALLDVLVESEDLTAEQREDATRTFIEVLIGDFPIDQMRLSLLTTKYHGAAYPTGAVFSRSAAWAKFVDAYRTWCALVNQSASEDRKHACDWLYYAVLGVTRAQPDAKLRKVPAAMLLSATVSYVSDYPDEVAKCVIAARSGLAAVGGEPATDDPLAHAVALLRASLAKLVGITEATSYVSRAFSNLQAEDRQTVLQVLYAP